MHETHGFAGDPIHSMIHLINGRLADIIKFRTSHNNTVGFRVIHIHEFFRKTGNEAFWVNYHIL